MMKIYARIEDGAVVEIIQPWTAKDGVAVDIPIEDRFTPEFVETLVDITDVSPAPDQRWTYDGKVFSSPEEHTQTPADTLAINTATRDYLIAQATTAVAPLQDAADLDEATAEEAASLKTWKQYRIAVNRIDLTLASPPWPAHPQ